MLNYNLADKKLHVLCQVLAKAGRSYIPEKEDDSHTNLAYDELGNQIKCRWIETETGRVLLSLNLSLLTFEWLNEKLEVLQTVKTAGKRIAEIEQELMMVTKKVNLKPSDFSGSLHFEIPDYGFNNDPIQPIKKELIEEWKYYRSLANKYCILVLDYTQTECEIRIWPHHFDTAIYINPTNEMGIGFGMAMKDEVVDEPYFYMSGYPTNGVLDYKNLPDLGAGQWKTESFKGAVLPLIKITESKGTLDLFIKSALGWFLRTS